MIFGKKIGKKRENGGKILSKKKDKKEPGRISAFHQYNSNDPQFAPLLDPDSSPKKWEANSRPNGRPNGRPAGRPDGRPVGRPIGRPA